MFYKVLGLMSGTSLDGLDLAYCEFEIKDDVWQYSIPKATTIPYNNELKEKILLSEHSAPEYLSYMDFYLGKYFGKQAYNFLKDNNLQVDFVSSHGQTIFHQPDKGFTTQIGNISALCSEAKTTVVGDFRSLDVALGGQGAPLVPIGDRLLFRDYDYCLNLGGFSNISYEDNSKRKAYDICPVNMVLNYLASMLGKSFDDRGMLARKGKINETLLNTLNTLPYYKDNVQKSLGKEWVKQNIFPILSNFPLRVEDLLATYTEHIAVQMAKHIKGSTLVTGGGAYNDFLIEKLRERTEQNIVIPDKTTIDFKEALIFAFLGVKRIRKEVNCLASVTGAKQDCCSGSVVCWNEI
ncbi:MAG: anhydro-N-acetylmuramic acid kinase [Bacteroidales bacterium]|nr:anhydro-N-acetylmuramic acid kinase [Bacteroidales bacterium]